MYLVFRGCSCKPDNRTVVFNGTELHSVQDAVHLGHHVSTIMPMALQNSGEGMTCSWVILVIQRLLWDLLSKSVSHGANHSDSCGDWHLLHSAMLSRCCLIVCHYWSTYSKGS